MRGLFLEIRLLEEALPLPTLGGSATVLADAD